MTSTKYTKLDTRKITENKIYLAKLFYHFCNLYKAQVDYKKVHVSEEKIYDLIIRIDKRLDYFDHFHDITMSEYKKTALLSYWINKLRPYYYKKSIIINNEKYDINEVFATFIILVHLYGDNFEFIKKQGILLQYMSTLIYYFRFREMNQEGIMLGLEAFFFETLSKQKSS